MSQNYQKNVIYFDSTPPFWLLEKWPENAKISEFLATISKMSELTSRKYISKLRMGIPNLSEKLKFPWPRSSRSEVFCKKGVVRNIAKFTEKRLCQRLF